MTCVKTIAPLTYFNVFNRIDSSSLGNQPIQTGTCEVTMSKSIVKKLNTLKTVRLVGPKAREYSRWISFANQRVETPYFTIGGKLVERPYWISRRVN